MAAKPPGELKPLAWVGSAKKDLLALPEAVIDALGYALYVAQAGKKHEKAKALHGFGSAGILEIVEEWRGNAYRAVYTVRFSAAVFVLHVFQKKAKRGIATPRQDMELIRKRLEVAEQHGEGATKMSNRKVKGVEVEMGTGNVYADLGFADADEMLIKAQLVSKIAEIIKRKGLTQTQAAQLLGMPQPKLSNLLSGRFRGVSERRLMDCLVGSLDAMYRSSSKRRHGRGKTVGCRSSSPERLPGASSDWYRSYVVTLLAFVGLVPAFVPPLSKLGVCCKSLI